MLRVLNELAVKQGGVTVTYKLGTVNGYYNSADGKFYEESTYTTEIEGATNLVYVDISENTMYIYKTATSSFVQVSGGGGGLVYGYFNTSDGKFYEEDTYTTEIAGTDEKLFITLDDNNIYRYDETNTAFFQIGGSSAIVYVDTLPTINIKNVIYGTVSKISHTSVITDSFLDNDEAFVKTGDEVTGAYEYIPAEGVEIEASTDDVIYLGFTSLEFDGISVWTLTFNDGTSVVLASGDNFYYKQIFRNYYAGNGSEQKVYPLGSGGGGGAIYSPGEGIDITGSIIEVKPATSSTLGGVKPDDSTLVVDTNGMIKGNYQEGFGIDIDTNTIKTTDFVGTQGEWDALDSTQKAAYDFINITDDINNMQEGAPGHAISDDTSEKTQRSGLKFEGFSVTDDSTNDVTKIAEVPYTAGDGITITNKEIAAGDNISRTWTGTKAQWDAILDKSDYDGWIINITDDAAVGSGPVVDVVQDGNMNAVTSNAVYEALQNIGPGKTLVPWAQASDSEVAAMINAYYNDELTLTEIQTVWHVGDIRTITLGSIGAIGVGESHRSQNVDIVILDFEHDDLTTAINGHTKALITVQLKDCLRDATVADDDGQNNTEHGYMNDTNTNVGGWTSSKRRAWCNNYFYNAIPASMRTLIKPVNKLTSAGNQSDTINTDSDKCFLVSEIEVFGSIKYSKTGEGNQYNYFETESNRYKLPKWNSSGSSDRWWERSPYGSDAAAFCSVSTYGSANANGASSAYGLAPAWCL